MSELIQSNIDAAALAKLTEWTAKRDELLAGDSGTASTPRAAKLSGWHSTAFP